jgi:hypothetical protein
MDRNLQKQMAFNEKLNNSFEGNSKEKTFQLSCFLHRKCKFKKHNTLLHINLKALSMEEKDVDLWWDVVQDIVQKDIVKVCKKYKRNERLYRHKISYMEKVMPSFEYEPLIMSLEPKTSND